MFILQGMTFSLQKLNTLILSFVHPDKGSLRCLTGSDKPGNLLQGKITGKLVKGSQSQSHHGGHNLRTFKAVRALVVSCLGFQALLYTDLISEQGTKPHAFPHKLLSEF
jgi:hypothetical protein